MPESIGSEGAVYNTKIPALDENADIQTALRLYHYGANTSNPDPVSEDTSGIAGFLTGLQNKKVAKAPTVIPANANLNTNTAYRTTGFYQYTATPTGTGYPVALTGTLTVVGDGINTFQVFHASDNVRYWRTGVNSVWTTWKQENNHTHVASNITDPANITSGKIYAGGTSAGNATRIFIQSTTPTGAANGDLWFW